MFNSVQKLDACTPGTSQVLISDTLVRWFAVYTAPRHEKQVARHLAKRQIESFLPLYRSRRCWKDGSRKVLELPLFPSYIFVKIASAQRRVVVEAPGVVSFVGCGNKPVPLSNSEVEALRRGLDLCNVEPHPYLVIGERVRIMAGAFAGMEGILQRMGASCRVVLSFEQIRKSVAVEIDICDLDLVSQMPDNQLT